MRLRISGDCGEWWEREKEGEKKKDAKVWTVFDIGNDGIGKHGKVEGKKETWLEEMV